MLKEHLKFALKVVVALVIINAILDALSTFGGISVASNFVQHPLATLGLGAKASG